MTSSSFATQFDFSSRDDNRQKQFHGENSRDNKEKNHDGRKILGSLNQNSGRVQPFRAAKQVC